jgi:molybdopterin-guanine dinucleotide biosynthesis protein A
MQVCSRTRSFRFSLGVGACEFVTDAETQSMFDREELTSPSPSRSMHVFGVILAGGASRRFGVEKSATLLCGKPLLAWVKERANPQVAALVLNCNDPEIGKGVAGADRLADDTPGEGPIAGILAALAEAGPRGFSHVASFACDTPFFPRDTVARLASALRSSQADYAVASCGETAHRIFALWPVKCHAQLAHAFANGTRSMRDIEHWLEPTWADFSKNGGPDGDPFFNINTPEDLETAEQWLVAQRGAPKY